MFIEVHLGESQTPETPSTLDIIDGIIFIGPRYTWGPIYGSECLSLTIPCWDFTELTLADEDTNSILTDNANRAIQGNVAMHATWWPTLETLQGTSPDDQILNQFAIHP